jgi:hypothetical protein
LNIEEPKEVSIEGSLDVGIQIPEAQPMRFFARQIVMLHPEDRIFLLRMK